MKVIVAGTRWIEDYELVKRTIEDVINRAGIQITEVVSGKARGVDSLGERWANENNIPIEDKPADWDKFGLDAGKVRNREMGDCADILIAIWDDRSTGTKDMMDYMEKLNKPVYYVSPLHPDPIPMLFNFFD